MFVVTVLFQVKAGHTEAFHDAILKNAAESLKESGCHYFDVCFADEGRRCFLYELYSDRRAFEFHLTTLYFKEFDAASIPLIDSKKVDTYMLERNPRILQ